MKSHYTTKDNYEIGDFKLKHLPQLFGIFRKLEGYFPDGSEWKTESVTSFSVWWHRTVKESLIIMKDGKVAGCLYMHRLTPGHEGEAHTILDTPHQRNPQNTFEIVQFGLFYIFSKHSLQITSAVMPVEEDSPKLKFILRNGYKLDGVLRKYRKFNGEWIDYYLCTITREEYEDIHKIGPRHVDSGSSE